MSLWKSSWQLQLQSVITMCLLARTPAFFGPVFRSRRTILAASIFIEENLYRGNVTILQEEKHYLVVAKPPSVVCHHSEFTGSRSQNEVPMLQRVRQTIDRRVNLVHRLDRGCSGCLLMTYADDDLLNAEGVDSNPTAILSDAMASAECQKTYLALVRGEGILHDRDFKKEGWFKVDRPIKNEKGIENSATTWFRFVAGQDNERGTIDRPRASLVLCRPETGRWHQIRRHLNGLSHPILGDSTHGSSKENKEWRKRGMPTERTCLHLARLDFNSTPVSPSGFVVSCPLEPDMMHMLQQHLPKVLEDAVPILKEEGIDLSEKRPEPVPFSLPIP